MNAHPLAGKPAPASLLANLPRLVTAYYALRPDLAIAAQRVAFGTSGHRGSALNCGFNEAHILAITQAVCDERRERGVSGPLFLGMDTHALSEPAFASALEVLAANAVEVRIDRELGYTPTPAISHAILVHNRGAGSARADGIVITPSHNPPEDGGFKYNPPHGGPADTEVTAAIERRANALMAEGLAGVKRIAYERALRAATTRRHDYVASYVADLASAVDLDAVRSAGVRIGVDALGGAALAYWNAVADRYRLELSVANDTPDATFRFMTVDHDGRIRMDCSSPYAMAGLIGLKDRYDIAFGNDTDADRHGIVTRSLGLLNPNAYLAVAVSYLYAYRPGWPAAGGVGKTVVSSSLIDRVAADLGRRVIETPVGFKWFVQGLLEGSTPFAGEESAGASFVRRDGTVWTTDKDGLLLGLLAAEMTATTGRDPGERYRELVARLGEPAYERIDAPVTPAQKTLLGKLSPDRLGMKTLAGDPVIAVLDRAPGNGAAIGGLKVVARNGWFAVRPSGTEEVYKLYAESFAGREHLRQIQEEARSAIARIFTS